MAPLGLIEKKLIYCKKKLLRN